MKTVKFSVEDLYETLVSPSYYLKEELFKSLVKAKQHRIQANIDHKVKQFNREFCSFREVKTEVSKWHKQGQYRKIRLCRKSIDKINSLLKGQIRFNKLCSSSEELYFDLNKLALNLKK